MRQIVSLPKSPMFYALMSDFEKSRISNSVVSIPIWLSSLGLSDNEICWMLLLIMMV